MHVNPHLQRTKTRYNVYKLRYRQFGRKMPTVSTNIVVDLRKKHVDATSMSENSCVNFHRDTAMGTYLKILVLSQNWAFFH